MKDILLKWLRSKWVHIVVWAVFIFYETVLTGLVLKAFAHPMIYIFHYIINIIFFYFNAEIAFPWALNNATKSFWRVPLITVFVIACFIFAGYLADRFMLEMKFLENDKPVLFDMEYLLRVIYRCLYFLGFSIGYYFLIHFIREKRKTVALERQQFKNDINMERMETALSIAQNDFLRAQINPHFLFNTLDYVYHHLEEDSHAADAILTLSDMMRYAINKDDGSQSINIWDEIMHVEKLVYVYQLRSNFKMNIELLFAEDLSGVKFLPLILLTLVENIFKHGDLNSQVHGAFIKAALINDRIVIETSNLSKRANKADIKSNGLQNITRRLMFTYGNAASFEYTLDQQGVFKVVLSAPIF